MWQGYDFELVGYEVRDLRRARGWSQEKLAKEAGISRQTLSELERGRPPQPSTLDRVALALETTSSALLMAGAGPMPEALQEACAQGLIKDATMEEILRLRGAEGFLGRPCDPWDYQALLALMRRRPSGGSRDKA